MLNFKLISTRTGSGTDWKNKEISKPWLGKALR